MEEIRVDRTLYDPSATNTPQKIRRVNARIIEKRPSFWERLIGTHSDEISDYVIWDILIPAFKSTIIDAIVNSAEMLFYVEPGRSRGRDREKGRSTISYTGYYKDRDRGQDRDRGYSHRTRYDFDDILLPTRQDCEDVLGQLVDFIDEFGEVSVSALYDIVGKSDEYIDQKWGWKNLSQAGWRNVRGGYVLVLPKPKPLE